MPLVVTINLDLFKLCAIHTRNYKKWGGGGGGAETSFFNAVLPSFGDVIPTSFLVRSRDGFSFPVFLRVCVSLDAPSSVCASFGFPALSCTCGVLLLAIRVRPQLGQREMETFVGLVDEAIFSFEFACWHERGWHILKTHTQPVAVQPAVATPISLSSCFFCTRMPQFKII